MTLKTFVCRDCKETKSINRDGTGYANDLEGNKICYACCGEEDKRFMREKGKNTLYLSKNIVDQWRVTNWPGTLELIPTYIKKGKHNIATTRTDVWFNFEGSKWYGVNYGETSQILHCRKLKAKGE